MVYLCKDNYLYLCKDKYSPVYPLPWITAVLHKAGSAQVDHYHADDDDNGVDHDDDDDDNDNNNNNNDDDGGFKRHLPMNICLQSGWLRETLAES